MLHIRYKTLQSEFDYPFQTAYGIKTHQPALLVSISYNGISGFGEAPPVSYYNVTVESMVEELLQKIQILQRYSFTEPERFWHFCHHLFPTNNFLVCALDMAYWNLYAKIKQRSIRNLMGLSDEEKLPGEPITNYTVGLAPLPEMMKKIEAHPWPLYKVKMQSKEDIKIIEAIRKLSNATLRVDANASWTLSDALEIIPKLHELGVEFVEQPLAKDDWDGMRKLFQQSALPLLADEACVTEYDVKACSTCFHGITIKLTKCGGITPAVRMIREAKLANKQVMIGCMSETEIGSYAIAQFLPWLNYVDMDGPLLLKNISMNSLRYHDNGQVEILKEF